MFFIQAESGVSSTERKLELIYVKYRKLMLSAAYGVLHDYHLAEDAVHDVFIKLNQHPHNIPDPLSEKAAPYMAVAARNAALDYLEQIKQAQKTEDISQVQVADTSAPDLADQVGDKDAMARIIAAIRSLDPVYRDVLLLRFTYDYTAKEIAKFTGRKESTVKKQLLRGKELLAEAVRKEAVKYGRG